MPTLLFDGHETAIASARPEALWLDASALEAATGFHQEPQGFCRGELCVPIPPGAKARFVDGARVNVAALAEQLRRPVVSDDAHGVVSVGPEPGSRLAGAEAPDFSLPDFDGVQHSLSQYRGKKVLIMTWASW
jgi:AhpC/TSA family